MFRRDLIAIGRATAQQQPVADALVLQTLVAFVADGVAYVPPRQELWTVVGRDLELGWSLGFFDFEEARWLRLHLAGQLNAWSQLMSSGKSMHSVTLLGGVELMPPRVSSTRFQLGLLARAGILLTSRDRMGSEPCPDAGSSTVGLCSRPTFQVGLSGVALEHFRLHLVGAWYPWWNHGARALWSVAPAAGVQLTF